MPSCSVAVVGLDEGAGGVRVRVLGPIELLRDDGIVRLTGLKEQMLLAALAERANQVLSTSAAIDALWGERPPASARGLVHNYVSRLRKAFGTDILLERVTSGYRLRLGADDLDAVVFERLVGEGRRRRTIGDAPTAIELMDQALALWRGAALGDLAVETSMRGYAQRLEELRLHATEERGEALLALGRHGELVAELHNLVVEHPLREQFWAQLMRCLYSAGRQGEALRRGTSDSGMPPASSGSSRARPSCNWSGTSSAAPWPGSHRTRRTAPPSICGSLVPPAQRRLAGRLSSRACAACSIQNELSPWSGRGVWARPISRCSSSKPSTATWPSCRFPRSLTSMGRWPCWPAHSTCVRPQAICSTTACNCFSTMNECS